jgi:ubiquinone/menaquinone biosynthesis C-methylase UbiE
VPMSVVKAILMRAFGHPEGALGRLGGIIMARMNQRMAARAIELLDVQLSNKVLEVGFGPGVTIQLLAKSVLSGRVAGIDPSEEMIAQAAARNRKVIESGQVDLCQGSAGLLPFADNIFDRVLTINSMQIWPDAIAGLREMRRVMKPSGRIAVGFTRYSGQPKSGLIKKVVAAGFAYTQVVESEEGFCALATKP